MFPNSNPSTDTKIVVFGGNGTSKICLYLVCMSASIVSYFFLRLISTYSYVYRCKYLALFLEGPK